ncbi:MAG: OmpA family protein [Bryobacteraceae bacterium]|nr:OmpA family protein [Bryobacteraceae bacterium]
MSEERGSTVREYLTQQGLPSESLTSKGMGESQPVASSDTAARRQQNRRVELVISGDVIGTSTGSVVAGR